MMLKILKQKESPLLQRQRVSAEATFKGATPSKEVFKKELASKLKAKQDLIEIRHVYGKFGEQRVKIIAHVYKDEKVMKALVHKKKEKVKKEAKPKEEKKVEAPKAEVKKEEKPAEKKQEKKEEKKK